MVVSMTRLYKLYLSTL